MPGPVPAARAVSADGRNETHAQRDDRNWSEALQELRVLQTGTQVITGFLLAVAFQPAFADLSDGQRAFYLLLVVLAALSAIFALAPVALHRIVFHRHVKHLVVVYAQAALITALATVSVLVVGVVAFVFDVVVGGDAALVAACALGALVAGSWIVLPIVLRMRGRAMLAASETGEGGEGR